MDTTKLLLLSTMAIMLSACAATPQPAPAPGTGWSRAPDLSVYDAMQASAKLAREREILCEGRDPAHVRARWDYQFGAREVWVATALASRHGPIDLAAARSFSPGRVPCEPVADLTWHRSHARLLHLLEIRLRP